MTENDFAEMRSRALERAREEVDAITACMGRASEALSAPDSMSIPDLVSLTAVLAVLGHICREIP